MRQSRLGKRNTENASQTGYKDKTGSVILKMTCWQDGQDQPREMVISVTSDLTERLCNVMKISNTTGVHTY